MVDAHEMVGANVRRMVDNGKLNADQFIFVEHAFTCDVGCQTLISDLVGPNYICQLTYLVFEGACTEKLMEFARHHAKGCGICMASWCELDFAASLRGILPQTMTVFKIVKAIVERAMLGDERAKELIQSLREPDAPRRWEQVVHYAWRHQEFSDWLREVDTYGFDAEGRPRELAYRQTPDILGHGVREAVRRLEPLYAELLGITDLARGPAAVL